MIFRVIDNKLYEIKIYIKDEDEFINKNSTLNLIKVDQGKLPKYTGEEVDEIFYALDKDGNIVTEAGDRYGLRYEELLSFIIGAM